MRPETPLPFLLLAALAALSACGGPGGSSAAAVEPTGPAARRPEATATGDGLFARFPASGSVAVTLHPGAEAVIGRPTVVSFGAPFPPGVLTGADQLRAFDRGGTELEIHAAALLPWRPWPGRAGVRPSVRAAMVSIEVTLPERAPLPITLQYGAPPRARLAAPADPRADWVDVTDGEYQAGAAREPRVYATFTPDWLSACLLRTRATPAGRDGGWAWFDRALVAYARTAVNDVPAAVTNRLPIETDHEPWLFDRTATLFGVYVRTGDVKWLRHAHRSAQFYLKHITADGHFDLKPQPDMKYGYGRSLLMDFQMTGDPAMLDGIERIAAAATEWKAVYGPRTNFWTERHQAYALLAALSAWEANGADAHATRAREVADASFAMAARPAGSWRAEGCLLHTMDSHEGSGGPEPVCSPWMSALFADAVWEYWIHSQDRDALGFLAGLGGFVAERGLYPGGQHIDHTMPWYLASSVKTFSDDGPWGDIEHTCDVAGLVARAAWAEQQLGRDPDRLRDTAAKLIDGCRYNLDAWHRPNGPASGKSEWRLAPGRKFNWWFGTTSDLPWLMAATARK
ncbi:MAG TPA: hypothetical protein VK698_23225 [Kofleriaceae bacterium]|nr:hypothetical protein [Kofleriaceae bacterium]